VDRFGNENTNQIDANAIKAKSHRRVKSGVPEQVAQNSLKMPIMMQQINKQGPTDNQMQPSSGQRSMKNIIKMQKQAHPHQNHSQVHHSQVQQQNLMLIYEENAKDQIIMFNQNNSRANNKIVNVSFNDFS
jgi:hypothetical protein